MDVEVLKSIPLFADLSDDVLRTLSLTMHELTVSEGTHIVDEGNYSYELSVIASGTADVHRGGEVVASIGPGDFFGEVGVLEREQRNASVIATSRVHLLTLTSWDLRRVSKSAPELVEKLKSAASTRHD